MMKDKIIIFGCGEYGEEAYDITHNNHNILYFADNNPDKISNRLHGIEIIDGGKIKEYKTENVDVLVAVRNHLEIDKQLISLGIEDYYLIEEGIIYCNRISQKSKMINRCTRCVMDDSSDRYILFDEEGRCNYCNSTLQNIGKVYFPNQKGNEKLKLLLKEIKDSEKNKKYDCIMGISGGLDSSYLLYLGYKWNLRILAIHIDDGYDTDISKSNIRKLIEKTGFDYEVITPDSEQYNDLILSYMKAGVPNLAVPQDNILLAFLYKKLEEYRLNYFLSGGNFALECILQRDNTYSNTDTNNIYAIHKMFGTKPIDRLEFISEERIKEKETKEHIKTCRPLNYIDYNRDRAFEELRDFCGYEYYGSKHLENTLTAFIQLYWFPKKFGVDKRTSHLSSMIVSGQMNREAAMKVLEKPICDNDKMESIIEIVKKGLGLSDGQFERIMNVQVHQHADYKEE